MIQQLLKNWKTTSAGLLLIGGSTIHLVFCIKSHTADESIWTVTFASIIGGLGLMFAGDANVPPPVTVQNSAEIDRINALGSDPNSKRLAPEIPVVPNPPVNSDPTPISVPAK